MPISAGNFALDPADGRTIASELEKCLSLAGAYTDAAHPLTVAAVQTANYTVTIGQFVPCDVTSGAITLTLPTPGAGNQDNLGIGALIVAQASPPHAVTLQASGSDRFIGGGTTATLTGVQGGVWVYKSGTWYQTAASGPLLISAPLTVTYDSVTGNLSSVSDPSGTVDLMNWGSSGLISYRENGVIRTVTRDGQGRVTAIN